VTSRTWGGASKHCVNVNLRAANKKRINIDDKLIEAKTLETKYCEKQSNTNKTNYCNYERLKMGRFDKQYYQLTCMGSSENYFV